MDHETYELLCAISESNKQLKIQAKRITEIPSVIGVTHWRNFAKVTGGWRFDEDVEAELISGEAISWCFAIETNEKRTTIEADVRRVRREGQDVGAKVAELAFLTDADWSVAVPGVLRILCSVSPL